MSDLEPLPQPATTAPSGVAQPSRRWALLGGVALLTAAAAAVHLRAADPGPDSVDASEVARRTAALAALGPLPLAASGPEDSAAALARSGLPASEGAALLANAKAGRTRMVLLSVYDSDVEDGDVAEISSAGFSQVVRLTKAPAVLAVPVGPDDTISIAGLVDGGGGGVTVGLVLPGGPFPLPPLSVGQVLRIPVRPVP